MSDKPLWSMDRNGAYCLLFPNRHALSHQEIKEIFSKFGNVTNITAAGNETGFRFVEYSTLEDVERAVENLKNHATIKLIQYCPKKKNNENTNSPLKCKENYRNPRKQASNPINKNKRLSLDNKSQLQNESVEKQITLLESNNLDYATNDNKTVCNSSTSNSKFSDDETSPKSKRILNSNVMDKMPSDSFNITYTAQMLLKLRGTNASTFSLMDSCSNSSRNTMNDIYDDKIPDLVTKGNSRVSRESKKLILNAEEIIVANIHDNYGSAYMLHLFEHFKPLAVTYIKVLQKNKTRYCHIYFKTVHDAIEVETHFDKYNLSGKKLTVLRPCRLIEEAMNDN